MSSSARLYMSLIVNKGAKQVAGDVLDPDYEQEIEIEDWEWKLTGPERSGKVDADADADGKATSLRTTASEFTFTKVMDRASTQMLSLLASGEELSAVVTLVQTSDIPFKLVAHLEKARISGYTLNAKDEEKSTSIEESWVFNYETITLEHEPEQSRAKSMQAFTTRHKRDEKDNLRSIDKSSTAAADNFNRLGLAEQDAFLRDIRAVRLTTGQKRDEKDEVRGSVSSTRAIVDDFKKLKSAEQDAFLRDIKAVRR